MPIVQIHLMNGRDENKKRELVIEVTQAICKTLEVPPEKVQIILSEMLPENYALAGELKVDKKK